MSCLTTSATRRSRSVPAAVLIASAAASSHDVLLVPMISVTLYTLMTLSFDHVRPASGAAAASLPQSHPARSSMQASWQQPALLRDPGQDRGNSGEDVIDTLRDHGVHGLIDVEGVSDLRGVAGGGSQRDRGDRIAGDRHHQAVRLG